MAINQSEAELRRIWGKNFDNRMGDALDVFDTLPAAAQQRINNGGASELKALAAMKDPAYLDPKHPDHDVVSKRVSEQFNSLFGSDPAVF